MQRRSHQLNRLMWARLRDISAQVLWHGKRYDETQWKHIFSAMLEGQEAVPALEGEGIIFIPTRTSNKPKEWHIALETYIDAFAAMQGVKYTAPSYYDDYVQIKKTA